MITIRFPREYEISTIQKVLNHKSIIQYLGGFTMTETIKAKVKDRKACMWVAELADLTENSAESIGGMVGAFMIAGRPQSHLLKYGEVGVIEAFRRQRVGSAMYLAATMQGILEGRRLFEDTIVGDNPTQFFVLPSMGLYQAGQLRHRTASAKDICLFQFTLLDAGVFEKMLARIPPTFKIHLRSGPYSQDLWNKNMDIYGKHSPDFIPIITRYREMITQNENVVIEPEPAATRGGK